MLPNVLPILMVFGGMGWLGIDVDVGSMMTASIALGVAVDDTIHYLNWFREELDRLGDRKKAILAAYKHCATPTLQAAIDQRPGAVGLCDQHVHAHAAVRRADAGHPVAGRRRRVDLLPRPLGRPAGSGLQAAEEESRRQPTRRCRAPQPEADPAAS